MLSAVAYLRRRDPRERLAAIRRLGELGPAAAPVAGELIQRFRRTSDEERDAAVAALVAIGAAAVPVLTESLRHRESRCREE